MVLPALVALQVYEATKSRLEIRTVSNPDPQLQICFLIRINLRARSRDPYRSGIILFSVSKQNPNPWSDPNTQPDSQQSYRWLRIFIKVNSRIMIRNPVRSIGIAALVSMNNGAFLHLRLQNSEKQYLSPFSPIFPPPPNFLKIWGKAMPLCPSPEYASKYKMIFPKKSPAINFGKQHMHHSTCTRWCSRIRCALAEGIISNLICLRYSFTSTRS